MAEEPAAAEGALRAHVQRFNDGVRSGDFSEMVEHLHPDVEMTFAGGPGGSYVGRDAVAALYREGPPDDEVMLLLVHGSDDEAAADYAWRREPDRTAGRIAIRLTSGLIATIDIAVIDGEMGDA